MKAATSKVFAISVTGVVPVVTPSRAVPVRHTLEPRVDPASNEQHRVHRAWCVETDCGAAIVSYRVGQAVRTREAKFGD